MAQELHDGFVSLQEGMDGATPADYPSMQYRTAMAVNVSHRGGYAHQRPGFLKRVLDFQDDAAAEGHFEDDVFQGATAYYPDKADPMIVVSVGGRMFTINLSAGYRVADVTVGDGPDNSFLPKAWFTQVEKWLIKQNGIDPPVIFDGATSRRPAADEIGCGTCGVYAWGRYWYSMPNGTEYRASDIVYGNGARDGVLKITENTLLSGGGNFSVPGGAGKIRAMLAPAVLDNALGQGPVHVFCEKGVFSCNAPVDRDSWQDLTYPIQTVTLNQNGAMADTSSVIVNSDVFYRSTDGFRSYILARREFGDWANTPISREVEMFYKNDNHELLQYGTAATWENRALFGVMPQMTDGNGVVHRGLVVMDFDPISTLKGKTAPAWDGLWSGIKIHALVTVMIGNKERLFMLVRGSTDDLELWEARSDSMTDDNLTSIEWLVMLRQMDFGTRWDLKKLMHGELFVRKLSGGVYFDISYRPDDYLCSVDWTTFSECATVNNCSLDDCVTIYNMNPQYRACLRFRQPDDECNSISDRQMRFAYKFQPIIKVKGICELSGLRITAIPVTDTKDVSCTNWADQFPCKEHACCPIDPLEYEIEDNEE